MFNFGGPPVDDDNDNNLPGCGEKGRDDGMPGFGGGGMGMPMGGGGMSMGGGMPGMGGSMFGGPDMAGLEDQRKKQLEETNEIYRRVREGGDHTFEIKAFGCMLGAFIGDSTGSYLEFSKFPASV